MRYYRRLYWGEDLKKKKENFMRRLNTGKLQRDIYVLVLPEHGSNQLEIYNAALFRDGLLRHHLPGYCLPENRSGVRKEGEGDQGENRRGRNGRNGSDRID